jgi:23S rRNA (uridine2552-2'-O)-methyltransferase
MGYDANDYYTKKAREQNYAARSVFKLEEMDQKFKLFKPHQKILDLGAAPGSWSQYASKKIGPKGFLLGLDLTKITLKMPNSVFLQADLLQDDIHEICRSIDQPDATFDVVMSDMAPKTTGIKLTDQVRSLELCEMALNVAEKHLRPGGHFICKLFHSEDFKEYKTRLQSLFKKVDVMKPKATRQISKEIFFIALNKK